MGGWGQNVSGGNWLGLEWIQLAHDRGQRWAAVNAVKNFEFWCDIVS
jgi:hypothetical protein